MELEETANPETEIETPVAEAEPDTTETEASETEAESDDTEQPDQTEGDDEHEDVEIQGKTYKLPKEIAPFFMMDRDYRQKTMAHADVVRAHEAREAEFRQATEQFQAFRDTQITVARMDAEISELANINYEQLAVDNPQEANRLWFRLQTLQNERSGAVQHLNRLSEESRQASERSRANAVEQAVKTLSKPDPELGWSGKLDEQTGQRLTKVGLQFGMSLDTLKQFQGEPILYKLLNAAEIGLKVIQKQKTAAKPSAPQPKPVPTVGANKAKGSVDPEKLSPEQWMKWREADLKKKGLR